MVITTFQNRKSSLGTRVETTWEEFVDRLKTAEITSETLDEYQEMTNEQRTEIKDCGGYVAGEFKNNKRSKSNLINRCVLAVDADSATDHDIEDYEAMYDYKYFVHTTHTSTPEAPRYRWLFPLSRPVNSSEYRQLVAEAKLWVGADTIDETTDQAERLMFWPSVCLDVDYQWKEGGTELLNPDDFVKDEEELPVEVVDSPPVIATDGIIPEGQRNKAVFEYASLLRGKGLDRQVIRHSIAIYNDAYCSPPLPDLELNNIASSVCKYQKGEKIPFRARDTKMEFSDLGEVRTTDKFARYKVERVSDLLERDVPETEFIIPGMLPVGLGMLLAPPKFGKSWFCLDLAISIVTGTDFIGMHTNRCEVFYAALEDGDPRLKSRIREVGGEDYRLGKNLYGFYKILELPTMHDSEVIEYLQSQLDEHPGIRVMIIDTLQKIRGEIKKNEGVYGYDYRELSELQRFAIKNNICLLLVHHTKKGIDDSDFLGNASGSNGITGALDFMLSLTKKRRKDSATVLDITGRDVQMKSYVLQFNNATLRWENLGEEQEVKENEADLKYSNDPLVKTIKHYLETAEELLMDSGDTDTDEVRWVVSSQDIVTAIKSHCGNTEYDSAVKIGQKLGSSKQLEETAFCKAMQIKDGLFHTFDRTGSKRRHVFLRERLS